MKIFIKYVANFLIKKIHELCLSVIIPEVYNEILKKYSMQGLRVYAFGMRLVKMTNL